MASSQFRTSSSSQLRTVASATATAELFEHIVRSLYAASFTHQLNPAQWNALRYFRSAPANARSLKSFARHQLVADSTASQTIAALVRKSLVTKERDPDDRRGVVIALTETGHEILRHDPMLRLASAFAELEEEALTTAADVASRVAKRLFLMQDAEKP